MTLERYRAGEAECKARGWLTAAGAITVEGRDARAQADAAKRLPIL